MRCGVVAGRAVSLFQLARFLRHAEMLSTAQFALVFAMVAACHYVNFFRWWLHACSAWLAARGDAAAPRAGPVAVCLARSPHWWETIVCSLENFDDDRFKYFFRVTRQRAEFLCTHPSMVARLSKQDLVNCAADQFSTQF